MNGSSRRHVLRLPCSVSSRHIALSIVRAPGLSLAEPISECGTLMKVTDTELDAVLMVRLAPAFDSNCTLLNARSRF